MTQPDTQPTAGLRVAYDRPETGDEMIRWLADAETVKAQRDELQASLDAARRQARVNEGNLQRAQATLDNLQRAQATLDNVQRNLAEDLDMQGAGLVTLIEESRRRAAERTAIGDLRSACPDCGPGYRYGDDGCRHTPPTTDPATELDRLRSAVRHVTQMAALGTPLAPLLHAVVDLERHLPPQERQL